MMEASFLQYMLSIGSGGLVGFALGLIGGGGHGRRRRGQVAGGIAHAEYTGPGGRGGH